VKFRDVWRRKFWKKISSANSTSFDEHFFSISLMSQYKKSERQYPKTKQNKTSINKQPYSKENGIRDANICQTRIKQPCQQYTISALTNIIVDLEYQEGAK
jgi:hypothetical protein